jgi:tetratricopeptide (TPR) repeat protein
MPGGISNSSRTRTFSQKLVHGSVSTYVLSFLMVLISGVAVAGPAGYTIQVAALTDKKQLEPFQGEVTRATGLQVFVQARSNNLRTPEAVCVGKFRNYGEAWAFKNAMLAANINGIKEAFITPYESDDSELPPLNQLCPLLPFNLTGLGSLSMESIASEEFQRSLVEVTIPGVTDVSGTVDSDAVMQGPAANSKENLLAAGFRGTKNSEAAKALDSFLQAYPSDPAGNKVRLRLARRIMARKEFGRARELLAVVQAQGNSEEKAKVHLIGAYLPGHESGSMATWKSFSALADDQSLSAQIRVHAMWRAAAAAHAAQELTSSVLAFKQLSLVLKHPADRWEAEVELAGLYFELVGREKGNWQDVVNACESIRRASDAPKKCRATASLMHMEAQYYAGHTEIALNECVGFLVEFSDFRREYTSALVWRGVLLAELNRDDAAVLALRKVLDLNITSQDKFGNHEPQARAAFWLAHLSSKKGDSSAAEQYRSYIRSSYPKSSEALKLK